MTPGLRMMGWVTETVRYNRSTHYTTDATTRQCEGDPVSPLTVCGCRARRLRSRLASRLLMYARGSVWVTALCPGGARPSRASRLLGVLAPARDEVQP
eukprot:3128124-Prymnesium_polylepis.1